MLARFLPLKTIRGQIFFAFCAMSGLAGALGAYGIYATTIAHRIVVDTYDRPLMAINFARAASVTFTQMENQLLEARLAADGSAFAKLKGLADIFFDDLAIAKQRSMSAAAVNTAQNLRGLAQKWLTLVDAAIETGSIGGNAARDLNILSDQILNEFDRLIEFTAEDGFRERQLSLGELDRVTIVSLIGGLLAVALAGIITVILARRILRPLSTAAQAADRIAQGDFAAALPQARQDEIGRLLRSMQRMQASIQTMMDREAAERRSAQRCLLDAVEGSREAMMLVGADGNIVVANTQVLKFVPGSPDDLRPGTSFAEMVSQVVPADASDETGDRLDPATLLATEGEVRLRPDLWLKISRSATQDGGFFLFWSDISGIKEREARLVEAKQEAEAASRAKSNFLATMSHELRTPLNAIIGFSEIIESEMLGPIGNARYREYGGIILRSGRHLLDVISTVLDYAKSEAGQAQLRAEPVDLGEIVRGCAQMVDGQCRQGEIELHCTLPAVPLVIAGDAQKLRQMLLNLLSNSIKFTPAGGCVSVALARTPGGGALLSVSDTGIGMKPDDIPIALTPFGQIDSRLARHYEGTGLGLPLAKAFAELHQASFAIVSELEKGTTISIEFPAASRSETVTPSEKLGIAA